MKFSKLEKNDKFSFTSGNEKDAVFKKIGKTSYVYDQTQSGSWTHFVTRDEDVEKKQPMSKLGKMIIERCNKSIMTNNLLLASEDIDVIMHSLGVSAREVIDYAKNLMVFTYYS